MSALRSVRRPGAARLAARAASIAFGLGLVLVMGITASAGRRTAIGSRSGPRPGSP
jgi:hypothetical protein